jgi:hypothetical protein
MLSSTEARERLTAMRRPAAPGAALDPFRRHRVDARAEGERLHGLSARARRRDLEQRLPGLGRELAWMWDDGARLPYQLGMLRRAFRAPNNPEWSLATRFQRMTMVTACVAPYAHEGPAWVARWAPYINWQGGGLGPFLASVIDHGGPAGDEVFEILVASAEGEDEIGAMGRHVAGGLLGCARADGWEYVERLLLAAQRQEGLRQTIFESSDEAHPDAFRRMLGVILDHDLVRFSSCARAVGVWLGLPQDAGDTRRRRAVLQDAVTYLDDPAARAAAFAGGAPADAHLALCCEAWGDVAAAYERVMAGGRAPDDHRRYALHVFLAETHIPPASNPLSAALADPELEIAAVAVRGLASYTRAPSGTAGRLEAILKRLGGRPAELREMVWPGTAGRLTPDEVAEQLIRWTPRDAASRLIPHLGSMNSLQRRLVAQRLGPGDRDTVLALLGDASATVREVAIVKASEIELSDDDALGVERLLSRKATDLRRGIVALLLRRGPEMAAASAERLEADADPQRRAAGQELRAHLDDARTAQRPSAERHPRRASRADGLGLVDAAALTPPLQPERRPSLTFPSDAARAALHALDALISAHAHDEVEIEAWEARGKGRLFGEIGNRLSPLIAVRQALLDLTPPAEGAAEGLRQLAAGRLPLLDTWCAWAAARPAAERDADGLELLRAQITPLASPARQLGRWSEMAEAALAATGAGELVTVANNAAVRGIVLWLIALDPPPGAAPFLLDAAEHMLASVPDEMLLIPPERPLVHGTWRHQGWMLPLGLARTLRHLAPDAFGPDDTARLWGLERWAQAPSRPGLDPARVQIQRPPLDELVSAFAVGAASDADVLDHLLGPSDSGVSGVVTFGYNTAIHAVTGRALPPRYGEQPALAELVDRARRRVVEVELQRGEAPTDAAPLAKALRYSGGMDTLLRVAAGLGSEKLVRGWSWQDSLSRKSVYSHLIRVTFPEAGDTPEGFADAVRETKLKPARLLELAAFAPQWARHVEEAVGWSGLADAVWWLHAHTKDAKWTVDQLIRDAWSAEVAERTPLTGPELLEGACDVEWWARVHERLGPERWRSLDAAAKYCSSSGGHKRAQLFSAAMAGAETVPGLLTRVEGKRQQDAVRALGLVPLGADRTADMHARYEAIQEFTRTSRQFGSQRRASERRAAEIGLANLARTAGYRNPLRLEWAMEARTVPDSPAELRRRRSRIRTSLEQMMIRGDAISGDELAGLAGHPLLYPLLSGLVLHGEGIRGYPLADGRSLRGLGDERLAVGHDELLRIAHPVDLLAAGDWPAWQRDCLERGEAQPFKQLFRELYLLTDQERADVTSSARYAGHQLQPRAALALLGGRGWVAHPEEGVRRTYHDAGVTASLWFLGGFGTPLEVEAPTLERVAFSRVGEFAALALSEVPPRVFSEVMRDVDLVVSVAHVGGVDPEASASTVEMRGALLAETLRLLKLGNVTVSGSRALIEGRLASYSVHLGSATVHQQPGGAVCIVPVGNQHRGRVFLPFADDDPKTAEVIAKVLLLARDHEIKDPAILAQIQIG